MKNKNKIAQSLSFCFLLNYANLISREEKNVHVGVVATLLSIEYCSQKNFFCVLLVVNFVFVVLVLVVVVVFLVVCFSLLLFGWQWFIETGRVPQIILSSMMQNIA